MVGGVHLVKIALQSPSRAPFCSAVQWRVALNVLEPAPPDPIDVVFSWLRSDDTAGDGRGDLVLDELEIGPLEVGINEMVLEHDPPPFEDLALESILDDTGITISFRYRDQEFLHVGAQVSIEAAAPAGTAAGAGDAVDDEDTLPDEVSPENLVRVIDAARTYVTSRAVAWERGGEGKGDLPQSAGNADGPVNDEPSEDDDEEEEEEEKEEEESDAADNDDTAHPGENNGDAAGAQSPALKAARSE